MRERRSIKVVCSSLLLTTLSMCDAGTWKCKADRCEQRKRFWRMIVELNANSKHSSDFSQVVYVCTSNKRLQTDEGRTRYAFRYWMKQASLSRMLEALLRLPQSALEYWYDNDPTNTDHSLLLTEALSEQLRSLLMTSGASLKFELDLANDFFLDVTWQLPCVTRKQLVPCTQLGIQVVFEEGFSIITKVNSDSVLADNTARVGDILLQIDQTLLFPTHASARNSPQRVWRARDRDQPCHLTVATQRALAAGGSVFAPFRTAIGLFQRTLAKFHAEWERELDRRTREADRNYHPTAPKKLQQPGFGVIT